MSAWKEFKIEVGCLFYEVTMLLAIAVPAAIVALALIGFAQAARGADADLDAAKAKARSILVVKAKPKVGIEETSDRGIPPSTPRRTKKCEKCGDDCRCVGGCGCEAAARVEALLASPVMHLRADGTLVGMTMRESLAAGGKLSDKTVAYYKMTPAEVAAVNVYYRPPVMTVYHVPAPPPEYHPVWNQRSFGLGVGIGFGAGCTTGG